MGSWYTPFKLKDLEEQATKNERMKDRGVKRKKEGDEVRGGGGKHKPVQCQASWNPRRAPAPHTLASSVVTPNSVQLTLRGAASTVMHYN